MPCIVGGTTLVVVNPLFGVQCGLWSAVSATQADLIASDASLIRVVCSLLLALTAPSVCPCTATQHMDPERQQYPVGDALEASLLHSLGNRLAHVPYWHL